MAIHNTGAAMLPVQSDAGCLTCAARPYCMVAELSDAELGRVARLIERRLPLMRGQQLAATGNGGDRLYAVRRGHLKVLRSTGSGAQSIDSFPREGDLFSLEPVECGTTAASAQALCDSEICELSLGRLRDAAKLDSAIARMLFGMLHKRLLRQQTLNRLLRCANAQQRLAGALIDLADTGAARGAGALRLVLPMSRQELGDHLGLSGATVSRLLVRLQGHGAIALERSAIVIRDLDRLRSLMGKKAA